MNPSFPAALRAAISASGLSLERIQYRLRLRDVRVSVPTISNWQSGRRHPERAESLRAVAGLEQVLHLPAGALLNLLEPPRPHGRAIRPPAPARGLLSTVETGRLLRLSQHDTVLVAATGRPTMLRTRHVFRARQDGADRWVDVWHHGTAAVTTAEHRHCRAGETGVDRRARLAAAELVLDTPLRKDTTAITEYRVDFPDAGGPAGRFFRRFSLPVREYVLEIRFDAAAMPTRCRRGKSGEMLEPSRTGSVHLVELDVTGLVDVTWEMGGHRPASR